MGCLMRHEVSFWLVIVLLFVFICNLGEIKLDRDRDEVPSELKLLAATTIIFW